MNVLLSNDVRKLIENANQVTPAPTVPPLLYHYTNTTGLIGILDTKKIWATHVSYLNDSSELVYATNLLNTVLDEHIEVAKLVHTKELLSSLKGTSLLNMFECFVACFCEKPDLLNQWRVYSNKDGYSLGFDGRSLDAYKAVGLCKIIYERSQQRDLIGAILGPVMLLLDRELVDFDVTNRTQISALNSVRFDLRHTLAALLAAFKNHAFHVEHEWRLIYGVSGDMQNCKFRAGAFGLTPYREFDLEEGRPFPLRTVRLGPGSHPENTQRAVEALLLSKGINNVDVRKTNLPVRV